MSSRHNNIDNDKTNKTKTHITDTCCYHPPHDNTSPTTNHKHCPPFHYEEIPQRSDTLIAESPPYTIHNIWFPYGFATTVTKQCCPHHTTPHHTTPYHTIPYHTIPYHTIPYHTIPYHTIPYHTIQHHIAASSIPKAWVTPHNTMLQKRATRSGPVCSSWALLMHTKLDENMCIAI